MTERDRYLGWLVSFVESDYFSLDHYSYLASQLLSTKFTWFKTDTNDLYMDENRAGDGLHLRSEYCDSFNVDYDELSTAIRMGQDCSILEMMVAFARRIDDEVMWDNKYGNRSYVWFWYMLYGLKLDNCCDGPKYSQLGVTRKLNKFLRREYGIDGYGGIFYLETNDPQDVTKYFDYIPDYYPYMPEMELWQQMGVWTQLYDAGIILKQQKIENYRLEKVQFFEKKW